MKYIHIHKWVEAAMIVLSILFYIFLVGIEVPVLRAAIMGIVSYGIATS